MGLAITLFLVILFRLSYKPLQINFFKEYLRNNETLKEAFGDITVDNLKVKLNLLENKVNVSVGNLNYLTNKKSLEKIEAKNMSLDFDAVNLLKGLYRVIGINIENGNVLYVLRNNKENINFNELFDKKLINSDIKNIKLTNINIGVIDQSKKKVADAYILDSKISINDNHLVLDHLRLMEAKFYLKNYKNSIKLENVTLSEFGENQYIGNVSNISIFIDKKYKPLNNIIFEKKKLTFKETAIKFNIEDGKFLITSNLIINKNKVALEALGSFQNFDFSEVILAGKFDKFNLADFIDGNNNLPYRLKDSETNQIVIEGNFTLNLKNRQINSIGFDIYNKEEEFKKYTFITQDKKKFEINLKEFLVRGKYKDNTLKILESNFILQKGRIGIIGKIDNFFDEKEYKLAFSLNNVKANEVLKMQYLKEKIYFNAFNEILVKNGFIKQAFFEIKAYDNKIILKSLIANIKNLNLNLRDEKVLDVKGLNIEIQDKKLTMKAKKAYLSSTENKTIKIKDAKIFIKDYLNSAAIKNNYSVSANIEADYQNLINVVKSIKISNLKQYTIDRLKGKVKADFVFSSLYDNSLKENQIEYVIKGKLEGFSTIENSQIRPIPFKLKNFNGNINAENNILSIDGLGLLNDSDTKFKLKIDENKKLTGRLKSYAKHDSFNFLGKFNYLKSGKTKLEIEILKEDLRNSNWSAKVKGDLYNNKTFIKYIDYEKQKNQRGFLNGILYFEKFSVRRIENLKFFTDEILLRGDIKFNQNGQVKNIEVTEYLSNTEDIKASITNLQTDFPKIVLIGKKFNLHKYISKNNGASNNLDIELNIKNLYYDKRKIGEVKLKSRVVDSGIENLSGNIYSNDKVYVTFKKIKKDNANNTIYINFKDLGLFLNNINLTDNIIAGQGILNLNFDNNDYDLISGNYNIENYSIKNASYLARLLQLASFTGLVEILAIEGIPFNLLKGNFSVNKGKLAISNTRLEGVSLGVSVEGDLDLNKKNINLEGVLIPAYAINSIINKIPLVGDLVTGTKGEGLIGVNYKAKGTFDKPDYSINPFSIFTPGILRNIFRGDNEKENTNQ